MTFSFFIVPAYSSGNNDDGLDPTAPAINTSDTAGLISNSVDAPYTDNPSQLPNQETKLYTARYYILLVYSLLLFFQVRTKKNHWLDMHLYALAYLSARVSLTATNISY